MVSKIWQLKFKFPNSSPVLWHLMNSQYMAARKRQYRKVRVLLEIESLRLELAQNRSKLHTLGPKVDVIHPKGPSTQI